MTMIVGLNLSDKLYLAADSRVTTSDGKRADNVLKILPILEAISPTESNDNQICMAIAGDVRYAAFLYSEIHKALKENALPHDIRELFKEIDKFCESLTDKWLFTLKQPLAEAVLLFSGLWANRPKKINPKRVKDLVKFYQEGQKNGKTEEEMQKLIETDSNWKIIDEKMRKEAGKSVYESLLESRQPAIPKAILEAQKNGGELPMFSDSLIFSVDANLFDRTFKKESAEWGEWLAYGSKGLSKNDIPQDLLSHLEFTPGKEKNQEHLMESVMMYVTIRDFAEKNNIDTIGGTVIISAVKKKSHQLLTNPKDCRISKETGFIYQAAPNQWVPVVPFHHFFKSRKDIQATTRAMA